MNFFGLGGGHTYTHTVNLVLNLPNQGDCVELLRNIFHPMHIHELGIDISDAQPYAYIDPTTGGEFLGVNISLSNSGEVDYSRSCDEVAQVVYQLVANIQACIQGFVVNWECYIDQHIDQNIVYNASSFQQVTYVMPPTYYYGGYQPAWYTGGYGYYEVEGDGDVNFITPDGRRYEVWDD